MPLTLTEKEKCPSTSSSKFLKISFCFKFVTTLVEEVVTTLVEEVVIALEEEVVIALVKEVLSQIKVSTPRYLMCSPDSGEGCLSSEEFDFLLTSVKVDNANL